MKFLFAICASLLVTLSCFATDNIVIVFDDSGSMGQTMRKGGRTRMATAKEALTNVLSQVPDTTQVGLLTFTRGWLYDLQKVDREKLVDIINDSNWVPGGGTPLYRFIKQGGNRLLQERAKQGNVGYYKLIVVTDGEADRDDVSFNADSTFGDGSYKPGVLKDIINRGITVDAIGLEMKKDHALSTQINGRYMRGDDPESIQQSIKTAVAEIGFKNSKDDTSEEAFKEISDLPDNFVTASLQGLTEFRNYPLGEKPPIRIVKDGVIVEVPNTDTASADSGMGTGMIVLICLGCVIAFIAFLALISSGNRR